MRRLLTAVLIILVFLPVLYGQVRLNETTKIDFATIEQGKKILGAKDDYIEHFSKFDLQAKIKTDKDVTLENYLKNATDAVIDWTDEQKESLQPVLEELKDDLAFLKWNFPETVYLIRTDGREEAGASYTRGNGVVLQIIRGGPGSKGLILHELFHILTRHNPEMRDKLYEVIGFKKCNEIKMPAALSDITIANPDAPLNQHYIELTYAGEKVCAVPIIYSREPKYDANEGASFFQYMDVKLLIVRQDEADKQFKAVLKDDKPMLAGFDEVEGLYEQVGRNTGYIIHPEEMLADNFAILASGRTDVPSPEIPAKMRAILAKEEPKAETEPKIIKLVKPQMQGGKPLMEALKDRKTTREYSDRELPEQVLSNLLWAAFGINREDSGKRTAPTAMNRQEIDIYVAMSDGLYLYDAKEHSLKQTLTEDIREATGMQPFVKDAPVNLVFVADLTKMGGGSEQNKIFNAGTDTGFISQNVYLYCASEDLATVVRGMVDKDNLSKIMKLRDDQRIILAQTVGFPKN